MQLNEKLGITFWNHGGAHFGDLNEFEFDAYVDDIKKIYHAQYLAEKNDLKYLNTTDELYDYVKGLKSNCQKITEDEICDLVDNQGYKSVLDYNCNNNNNNYILQFKGINLLVED